MTLSCSWTFSPVDVSIRQFLSEPKYTRRLWLWPIRSISLCMYACMYACERSGCGWGGWVVDVVSPSDGCSCSSMLPCGVEELKSSVFTVARTCEASMEEGRDKACPSWLTSTTSFHRLPVWGLSVSPSTISVSESPTWVEAGPACSIVEDSVCVAGHSDLSVAETEEARGLRSYLFVKHSHFR